jgi:hypothetical protein
MSARSEAARPASTGHEEPGFWGPRAGYTSSAVLRAFRVSMTSSMATIACGETPSAANRHARFLRRERPLDGDYRTGSDDRLAAFRVVRNEFSTA